MEYIKDKWTNEKGYTLHIIPSKKFKTINIVAKFKGELSRNSITKRALLPNVLQQGTKSYPTRRDFQSHLDHLYGAGFGTDGAKKGNNHIISLRLEIANEKYIDGEATLLDQAISLLNEVMFYPNTEGQSFNKQIVEREKESLRQRIHALMDDKMAYANMRLIDEMCEGETYETHVHGYVEDLDSITPEDLYEYYEKMIKHDQLDIYILGDIEEEAIENKLVKRIEERSTVVNDQEPVKENPYIKKEKQKVVIEEQAVQQAKLHLGYRTNCTFSDDDYFALQVFNGLYGGFPNSKLFINVREKNSLAYYAASRIESHKGLLLVFSGIAASDYEQAREIIELQMEEMKQGIFTEEDLKETKELIVNQLLNTMDSPQGIIELLYQQVIGNKELTPQELIEKIKRVNSEEVIAIANKIEADTVYLLTSKDGDSNE